MRSHRERLFAARRGELRRRVVPHVICPHPDCQGIDVPACDWPTHRGRHRLNELRAENAARLNGPGLPTICEPNEDHPYQQSAAQTAYERAHIYGP